MEQLAEDVLETLRDEIGEEPLVGVSYYTGEGVGHVYRSEWATEKYEAEQVDEIVRDLQLESLGFGAQEQHQQEQLHATVRIYDEMLDIVVPVDGHQGIAVALALDEDYSVPAVVGQIEQAIEDSPKVQRQPVFQKR